MLKLENISKYYYSGNNIVLALRKINLEFNVGEFIAITGESGSGKSTLLNVLSNLDSYEEGKLYINNEDISNYTIEELDRYRKDYIGFIFQDYNIIDSYTVYQNVEMALTVQGYSKTEKHNKVVELIEKVGLTKQSKQKAIKLSGGEKQRTVIARTLATNCPILVCDEPTGNLDKESSKKILELLYKIGKDKLVIVVTHDFDSVKEFASRKIRLYDGEIVEDTIYKKNIKKTNTLVIHKEFNTKINDIFKISMNNILAVPRKSIFMGIVLLSIILVIFFTYGNGIIERNKVYSKTTPYFENADASRVIVTKYDNTPFTSTELSQISNVDNVRGVIENDIVFDTVLFNAMNNPITHAREFYYYKPLSYLSIDEFDLISGVLPAAKNEVVIGNNGLYDVGSYIALSNSHMLFEDEGLVTDQFIYKIVGIIEQDISLEYPMHSVYFTEEDLREISYTSIFESSEIYLEIIGTNIYHTPTDTWITPDIYDEVTIMIDVFSLVNSIWIDNTLEDNEILTFDMMFFDMCRTFGYKKEVRDDFDAGLCNVTDFINSHELTVSAITVFQNQNSFEDITFTSVSVTENAIDQIIYMNFDTYDKFFGESRYQVTAIVSDVFNGKMVVDDLEAMGYNVFYPSQVIDDDTAINIIISGIKLILIIGISIFGIFIVGYFVLRSVILSKTKDYLIFRSLGASKKTITIMLFMEIIVMTILPGILAILILFLLEGYKTPIPHLLKYFKVADYILITFTMFLVISIMTRNLTSKIYKVSIISSLKGVEQ